MAQTQVEQCMETIVNIFLQYSVRMGHFNMLSQAEFKQLLQKEFPHWLKDKKKNANVIEQIFQKLDKNKDKQVDFAEFMVLITELAIASHEYIHQGGHDGHVHHH